ncbi:MAG: LysR family transcriptional regulator [Chloroflexota bacterium]
MDLRQLTTFRHLARSLSFSRTADELSYAQSTVSNQIQTLEHELDVTLFDRLGKRVMLTPAGYQLLEYADKFQVLEEETRSVLGSEEVVTGAITIYAPSTLCIYRLPQILQTYRQCYPLVQLNIHANIAMAASDQLRAGTIDIAFDLDRPVNSVDLVTQTLTCEPLVFVTCPGHPLADRADFDITDLAGQSLVLTEATCNYRIKLEQMASDAGIPLENPMGFENVEAIKQCVKAGIGLSLLPKVVVAEDIARGVLVELPWRGEPMEFATQMLWHRDKWLSPALRHLIEVAEEFYKP